MSWDKCMKKKIEGKYGKDATQCIEASEHKDLEKYAKCIFDMVKDTTLAAVLANLTAWSVDCALDEESPEPVASQS